MNLIKNVDGNPDIWKGKVRQDLDTIQRNFNALQALFDALKTQVNTLAAADPAVINSANVVTAVPSQDFLSTVAVYLGLSGDGTPFHPLSVKVDGTTVTFDGSGQLVASGGGGGGATVSVADVTILGAACKTLFTTPVNIVPAVAGTSYILLKGYFHCAQPATYFFSRNGDIAYDVTGGAPVAISALGSIAGMQTNATQDVVKTMEPNTITSGALTTINGKGLWLQGAADNNVGGFDPTDANTIRVVLYYIATTAF